MRPALGTVAAGPGVFFPAAVIGINRLAREVEEVISGITWDQFGKFNFTGSNTVAEGFAGGSSVDIDVTAKLPDGNTDVDMSNNSFS